MSRVAKTNKAADEADFMTGNCCHSEKSSGTEIEGWFTGAIQDS